MNVANPGAGAEFTQAVPAGKRWLLLYGSWAFATDATAANRVSGVRIRDATPRELWRVKSNFNQPASQSTVYAIGPAGFDGPTLPAGAGGAQLLVCPVRCFLGAGFIVDSVTNAIAAGDQYSAITLLVEEWDA